MKILIVNYRDRLHPSAGGAEKHLHRIFSRIAARGHEVVLLTTSFPSAKAREMVDGILVVRKGGDLTFQLTAPLMVKKLDREFSFDVVCEDLNKLPLFVHWFVKKPFLVQMHHLWKGSIFYEASFLIAFFVWFFERLIPLFYRRERFAVVSPSTQGELTRLGIPQERISVIYNGADPGDRAEFRYSRKEGKPYFLWLSRVHRYKGIWIALEAFEKFSRMHPDVSLKIAGSGPELQKIPSWLKRKGLEDKVELCGFVDSETKHSLMAGAICLLQTSRKEGWGLTVIEAAQNTCMTIASDVPGLRDSVVDGKTGFLFPVGDSSCCASLMEKIYEDETLRKSISENALLHAENFSWDRAATDTLHLLEKCVEEARN